MAERWQEPKLSAVAAKLQRTYLGVEMEEVKSNWTTSKHQTSRAMATQSSPSPRGCWALLRSKVMGELGEVRAANTSSWERISEYFYTVLLPSPQNRILNRRAAVSTKRFLIFYFETFLAIFCLYTQCQQYVAPIHLRKHPLHPAPNAIYAHSLLFPFCSNLKYQDKKSTTSTNGFLQIKKKKKLHSTDRGWREN